MKYIKRVITLTILLLLGIVPVFAQGLPGDCDDADACPAPLDNWLIILVIGSLILTTVYLHSQQKKETIS